MPLYYRSRRQPSKKIGRLKGGGRQKADGGSAVERRVHIVHVLLVHPRLGQLDGLPETLEMDDLAFPQEADGVVHIRVVGNAEDIVIRHARLLLCCNCENATFCIYICGKCQKFQ